MNLNPRAKSLLGVMTVLLWTGVAVASWPGTKWLTAVAGAFALLRLWVLIRDWRR